ncbi:PREDICTED: jmjC domain-containing protein 7-like isoform X2 [Priapulus caudatus]|uniref:JmjC domain-containing protein 7-like isoform X2 n=1 Tax=Priapulus caudatus TaxID=37621 RepID=A0ABM1E9A0_PRICU|nr:PREDICTED: jmjC domain-containing protein 7-like isoform X2 [Priapulus caudatus]
MSPLRSMFSDKELSVAVTPNGYADAVLGNNFVMPEERKMAFSHFLDIIDKKVEANGVFYIQKQNSNLTEEFPELLGDVDADIGWATEAFGKRPDAVNFWMGEEQAISSLHKDPYENLYYVISGSKTFTLIPPTDRPFIPYKNYQPAEYHEDSATGKWEVVTKHGLDQVPWIPVDPLNPDVERFPQYADANVVTVTVNAGEMLYLPSLWFHHVMQSHGCIAVNYWYDMDYDMKYCYYELLNSLTQTLEEL